MSIKIICQRRYRENDKYNNIELANTYACYNRQEEYALQFNISYYIYNGPVSKRFGILINTSDVAANRLYIEDILVSRTNQKALYSKQNETALEAYSVLNTLRNSDKESLINALRVRLKLYEREGRDPELLRRIKEALKDLEEGHTLSYEQERDISVATATQAYVDEDPRDYARTLLFYDEKESDPDFLF